MGPDEHAPRPFVAMPGGESSASTNQRRSVRCGGSGEGCRVVVAVGAAGAGARCRWSCAYGRVVSLHDGLPVAIAHVREITRMVRPADVLIHWKNGQVDNIAAI